MKNSVLPETKTIISYIFKIFTDFTPYANKPSYVDQLLHM